MKLEFWKFYLFIAVVGGGVSALFWHELGEGASAGFHSLVSDDAPRFQLRDSELADIRSVSFERLHNNANLLAVKSVSIAGHEGASVQLAVLLQSRSTDNDFPWLKITISGQAGSRAVVFSPSEYTHGDKLGKDPLSVTVQIQPGERNFTVTPFYKGNK
ncbi:hypothetical protein DBR42_02170 [Pelomonas sp. HMWF004]|nr:hypothetical protein DBR42_02170 [Pelomonas sp. HMWF004]